jgi:NAD(P)-dependent dehydrogenase (short-subunit alcohol dehydrogenase family)
MLDFMTTSASRVAILTGASRGLGAATSRALATEGWTVIVDARDETALDLATADLGDSVVAVAGDVADPEHRHALIRAAIAAGGLDLLVNNASTLGPSPRPRLENFPVDLLAEVYEVNVLAPLALIQASLPLLRLRAGAVVNVTSDAAHEPYEGWGGYGSSKAALDQISNILACEEPDVAIYRFDPGDMNTRMHQEAFPDEDISDRPPPEQSVPPLLHLIEERPPSGAYRAGDLVSTG